MWHGTCTGLVIGHTWHFKHKDQNQRRNSQWSTDILRILKECLDRSSSKILKARNQLSHSSFLNNPTLVYDCQNVSNGSLLDTTRDRRKMHYNNTEWICVGSHLISLWQTCNNLQLNGRCPGDFALAICREADISFLYKVTRSTGEKSLSQRNRLRVITMI